MWPTQRSGGRRMRLHGLHGRSTRTMRCSATSGAYRHGIDGPNTATTGVPTAAARCIGPVSPVSRSRHCAQDARQDHEIHGALRVAASGTPLLEARVDARRRSRDRQAPPVSTTAASDLAREPAGRLGKAFDGPLLDRAAARGM